MAADDGDAYDGRKRGSAGRQEGCEVLRAGARQLRLH